MDTRPPIKSSLTVLDYGCGSGQIVKKLQDLNIAGYGCDIFYAAANYQDTLQPNLKTNTVRHMDGNMIPFDDNTLDLIVTNQVIEHVEDLDSVLKEITRVLKTRRDDVPYFFPSRHVA